MKNQKPRTPRQTARVKQSASRLSTALKIAEPKTLSGRAQSLYDDLVDLKGEITEARDKRQHALLQNAKYAELKDAAAAIVKQANAITKKFDVNHPQYKQNLAKLTEDAKKIGGVLSLVALQAIKQGVELEVWHGRGPGKKRVRLNVSVQTSLF